MRRASWRYTAMAQLFEQNTIVLWTEGSEDQPASESYDHVAEVVHRRLRERQNAAKARLAQGDPAKDPRYGDPKRG